MSLHTEINFEDDICNHLGANGWFYELGDAANYDSALALYPADVVAWVQASQPKSWESLVKTHGNAAEKSLLERIRRQLDERGTLDVLRFGVDMLGLRGSLQLAQFKPALGMNPELQANYAANRLRVVRQVRTTHGDIIDLVLFVNGLPVATAELKSEFTQGINEAVEQYRNDRQPRPKGKPSAEPLLDFPRGALVHFAVTNRTVDDDDQAGRAANTVFTVQLGRQRGSWQPREPARQPHRLLVGTGVGARELAGDFGPLRGDQAERQKADQRADFPALPPARRDAQAHCSRTERRRWAKIPDPTLGRVGQNQFDCVNGTLFGGFA